MDRNFEQEYKKAFEAAKGLHDAGNALTKKQMEIVFPQLAESDDERIRKFLIEMFSHGTWQKEWPFGPNEIVAWLEKQKEQKPSCGNVNVESEFDKGWRAGHKAGLKDAEQQKPAEWSEEDEEVMEDLYNFVISDFIQDHIHETRWKPWKTTLERNRQNRLKSIHPVSKESLQSWKPSEEQMKALQNAVALAAGNKVLAGLYEQLKSL